MFKNLCKNSHLENTQKKGWEQYDHCNVTLQYRKVDVKLDTGYLIGVYGIIESMSGFGGGECGGKTRVDGKNSSVAFCWAAFLV